MSVNVQKKKLQESEDAVKDGKGWLDLNELKLLMGQQGSL